MKRLTLIILSLLITVISWAADNDRVTLCNKSIEIKRNINLKGKTIVVPKGCVLEFTKGKLRNGTIIGNGTRINAGKKQIFENIEINPKGTWNNHKGYPEWFGASDRPSVDSKMAIQRAIDVADTCVLSQLYVI